jgi:hypothetical protein
VATILLPIVASATYNEAPRSTASIIFCQPASNQPPMTSTTMNQSINESRINQLINQSPPQAQKQIKHKKELSNANNHDNHRIVGADYL